MTSGPTPEEIVRLALEAISDKDAERLQPLLAPGVTIRTGRASHEGMDAALAWARKGYQHLDRRYVLAGLEPIGAAAGAGEGAFLGEGRVEYVWRETGEVGDSKPLWFAIEVDVGAALDARAARRRGLGPRRAHRRVGA